MASLLKYMKCIKVNYTHTHRVIKYQSNHSFLLIWLLQISIALRQTYYLKHIYCMFCTTVKPENRLQMFPQILPKTKFEKALKTEQSWMPWLKTFRKKEHKESVALLGVNLFCLHLLDKKGQSWITVNTATMKNKNYHFLPVYYFF